MTFRRHSNKVITRPGHQFQFAGFPAQLAAQTSPGDWSRVPPFLRASFRRLSRRRILLITNYGAVGDGTTDCTAAFSNAIAACNAAGGGRVVVPAGTFLTGAIHLLSNVNLYVAQGGKILFSTNTNAFLPVVFTRYQGIEVMNYSPFIYAYQPDEHRHHRAGHD